MLNKFFYIREYCRDTKTGTSVIENFYVNNKKVTRADFTKSLYDIGTTYTNFIRNSLSESYCVGQVRVETSYKEYELRG